MNILKTEGNSFRKSFDDGPGKIRARAAVWMAVITLAAACSGTARSEMVNFSFFLDTAGTVTGTLTLPTACNTGCTNAAITNFLLTSYPAVFDSDLGTPPEDITAPFFDSVSNEVSTNASGHITSIDVFITDPDHDNLQLNYAGQINELQGGNGLGVGNDSGFSGITFTTPTPEPGTSATVLLGMAALVGAKWRRSLVKVASK